jgi:hypothetical protein
MDCLISSVFPRACADQYNAFPYCSLFSPYTIEEATGLTENPTPLSQLDLSLLQRLIALIQGRDAALKALAAVREFVDLGGGGGSENIVELVDGAHGDASFVHLRLEVTCSL